MKVYKTITNKFMPIIENPTLELHAQYLAVLPFITFCIEITRITFGWEQVVFIFFFS